MQHPIQRVPNEIDISNFLQGKGMQLSDLSSAMGNDRGFYIHTTPHRGESFFMYRREPDEDKVLSLFDELNIPHFPRIETTGSYSVVKLPDATRALDMMKFTEQSPTDGAYLGAFEIMALLGKFLKRLQALLHTLPQNLSIASLALVPGEGELIYLIPPLLMGEILSPQILEAQLLETFNKIDPGNNHRGQVHELMRNYLEA